MKRETYVAPQIETLGEISELTAGGVQPNQDVPFGVANNTAYPVPS